MYHMYVAHLYLLHNAGLAIPCMLHATGTFIHYGQEIDMLCTTSKAIDCCNWYADMQLVTLLVSAGYNSTEVINDSGSYAILQSHW